MSLWSDLKESFWGPEGIFNSRPEGLLCRWAKEDLIEKYKLVFLEVFFLDSQKGDFIGTGLERRHYRRPDPSMKTQKEIYYRSEGCFFKTF